MSKKTIPENIKGYLYLLNTIVLFSTYEVVSKTLVGKADALQVNFIRFFIGGVVLLTVLLFKKDAGIGRKEFFSVVVIGFVNVVMSMSLLQLSLYAYNAQASVTAVIFSSNPVFVMLFAAITGKEKIGVYKLLGLLFGLLGIFVVFSEKLNFTSISWKSPFYAIVSAVFYGLYTVLGRKVSVRIGSLKMNTYSFLAGSLILLPFLLIFRIPVVTFDYSGIYQILYMSFILTGLAYLTYFAGLRIVGAGSGSLVFFIKPVLASILAIIFLNEKASLTLFAGTVLIISGIGIVVFQDRIKGLVRHMQKPSVKGNETQT